MRGGCDHRAGWPQILALPLSGRVTPGRSPKPSLGVTCRPEKDASPDHRLGPPGHGLSRLRPHGLAVCSAHMPAASCLGVSVPAVPHSVPRSHGPPVEKGPGGPLIDAAMRAAASLPPKGDALSPTQRPDVAEPVLRERPECDPGCHDFASPLEEPQKRVQHEGPAQGTHLRRREQSPPPPRMSCVHRRRSVLVSVHDARLSSSPFYR